MSVTCGGFTKTLTAQDACNTHTLMDPEVFISGLVAMNKAPQDYTVKELKETLLKNRRKIGEVGVAGIIPSLWTIQHADASGWSLIHRCHGHAGQAPSTSGARIQCFESCRLRTVMPVKGDEDPRTFNRH